MVADGQASWNAKAVADDPWVVFRSLLARYRAAHRPDLPPFQGGAAGFLALRPEPEYRDTVRIDVRPVKDRRLFGDQSCDSSAGPAEWRATDIRRRTL
ncbi:hypothetical protein AAFG13_35635 [Bradyrhizobium sp. B124]|uniref:hypothetical protein n=1 Tax=Bradyrhizobium sp. B124 TaxID=3140245 RepID=UPI003182D358